MTNLFKKIAYISFAGIIYGSNSYSQGDDVYKNMSLDELLNIDVVVTASKKPEDLFDAPLSVTIIKKDQILKAGCRSIVEALRLSPGLIVRETTPGNFDVHIRGFDDVTKNLYIPLPLNTNILVMIDNRIVYSYYSGGTMWETLPIDISDVERIEIVRGPASALYGPNAVNGVINIITSHSKAKGLNVFLNSALGSAGTKYANASVGYNSNDKTKITLSANYSEQFRIDKNYYDWIDAIYVPYNDLSLWNIKKDTTPKSLWNPRDYRTGNNNNEKNLNLSMRKLGTNIFLNHHFSDLSKIDFSAGAQQSYCQIPYFLNFTTPLSQITSKSVYSDVKVKLNNLFFQVNATAGDYLSYKFNSYKYVNLDLNVEYFIQVKDFSFRPGIDHKETFYDNPMTYDQTADLSKISTGFLNKFRRLSSDALLLLSEWKPNPKLRVISGLRVDKFNINPKLFLGTELGITYRLNKNNLLRATFSNAKRSPFIFDTYLNSKINVVYPINLPYNKGLVDIVSEQNYNATKSNNYYPSNTTWELGWRSKLLSNLTIDLEIFTSNIKDLLVPVLYRDLKVGVLVHPDLSIDTVEAVNANVDLYFQNDNVSAQQNGISVTFNYEPFDNLTIKLYCSVQKTQMLGNIKVKYITTDTTVNLGNLVNQHIELGSKSYVNMTDWNPNTTPDFYGGFIVDYGFNDRINVNVNSYFTARQLFSGLTFSNAIADYVAKSGSYTKEIPAWLVVNAKVSMNLWSRTRAYISGLNLLGKHREFGYTDQIGSTFTAGFQWGF